MATIQVGEKRYEDIQLIICDKDGTIVEFDAMWGNWIKNWIDRLIGHTKNQHELDWESFTRNLDRSLGFDRANTKVRPESPVAVSTMLKINTVASTVLYQSGIDWHAAEELVAQVASGPVVMTADMVQPVGAVKETFEAWRSAGIKVIIATSDDREPAIAATDLMGVTDLITEFYCGNDPIANKPNPEAIHTMSQKYGVAPNQMLMVGDALSDIAFGRNGELAGCIGISGGSGETEALQAAADVVVDSIEKIKVG